MDKIKIKGLSYEQLKDKLLTMGEKEFRTRQIYEWLHVKLVGEFDEMTNLSKALRSKLVSNFELTALEPVQVLTSEIDGTQKYLFRLADDNIIESVLMKYKHGSSVCISTQVGCKMGCRFCASTQNGLVRNLMADEMLDQVYRIQALSGERVSNVVLMGSGEPFDNFSEVLSFLDTITNEKGLHISQRNITISTCGLVPKILELAKYKLQITLAISLHAANDEARTELMPIGKKYSIEEILSACHTYFEQTKRRITIEYSLAAGKNDSAKDAADLVKLLRGLNCHVNLIPVNPIEESVLKESSMRNIKAFKNVLEKAHINVTIRREMGRDIQGACGQLRQRFLEAK